MNIVLKDHVTVVLAMITAWCLNQCQATCDYRQRPHPNGYCGERLATLHRNVCVYLRNEYPQYFSDSSSTSSRRTRSAEEGMSFLGFFEYAAMLEEQERNHNKERMFDKPGNGDEDGDGFNFHFDHLKATDPSTKTPSLSRRDLTRLASSLRDLEKRNDEGTAGTGHDAHAPLSRGKRNLVCECCYSECSVAKIARYC